MMHIFFRIALSVYELLERPSAIAGADIFAFVFLVVLKHS